MLFVYGVPFNSNYELCKALGYKGNINKQILDQRYGGSWERVADIRLHLDGLSAEDKRMELLRARGRWRGFNPEKLLLALKAIGLPDEGVIGVAARAADVQPDRLKAALQVLIDTLDAEKANAVLDGECE